MSFFLSHKAQEAEFELVRPAEESTTESGAHNRLFSGVAYWRGSFTFAGHRDSLGSLLGELERAQAPGASFFADLRPVKVAAPSWLPVGGHPANGPNQFAVGIGPGSTPYDVGAVVSFRRVVPGTPSQQEEGRKFVTARVVSGRTSEAGLYLYRLETPLPLEFAPASGVTIEVSFDRPHVRAQLRADSVQWTDRPGLTRPRTVAWTEDTGGNLTFLHDVLRSPTGGGVPVPNEYLITEDAAGFLSTEDGRYLITED